MSQLPTPAASAARAIVAGQVRHWLTMIAGAAIAHGIATEAQTGALVPALAEMATGAIIASAAMAWSWATARLKHSRYAGLVGLHDGRRVMSWREAVAIFAPFAFALFLCAVIVGLAAMPPALP